MPNLPEPFVYLEDIDPSIIQEISYATDNNFIGRPLDGYQSHRCVLPKPLALALANAQKDAKKQDLSLKIYEAYRPVRAVEDILLWSKDPSDQKMKAQYYPNIDKEKVFDLGYVLLRSAHCRGAAVDVTLVPLSSKKPLEMGTRFDAFDEHSHTENPNISEEAKKNRVLLCSIMHKHGFLNYPSEWWHFNFKDEPFPNTYFDFPIL